MTEKDDYKSDSQPTAEAESAPHILQNGTRHARLVRAAVPLLLALGCGSTTPHPHGPDYGWKDMPPPGYPLNLIYPMGCSEGLLETAEDNPGYVLSNWKDCEGEPYMDEVIEIAAKAGAEKDPDAVIKNFTYVIINKPYAHEVLMKAMGNAKDSFSYLTNEYNIDEIVNLPYAEEIFLKLAEEIPSLTLYDIEHFKDKPYASKVLMKILDNVDNERLESFYWMTSSAKQIAEQPYAEEVFLKLVDRIPEFMLPRSEVFADQPYASVIFIRLIKNIEDNDTLESSLKNTIYKIAEHPRAEEIFIQMADRIPEFTMQRIKWFFKDKPYAKEVIRRAKQAIKAEGAFEL